MDRESGDREIGRGRRWLVGLVIIQFGSGKFKREDIGQGDSLEGELVEWRDVEMGTLRFYFGIKVGYLLSRKVGFWSRWRSIKD